MGPGQAVFVLTAHSSRSSLCCLFLKLKVLVLQHLNVHKRLMLDAQEQQLPKMQGVLYDSIARVSRYRLHCLLLAGLLAFVLLLPDRKDRREVWAVCRYSLCCKHAEAQQVP